jgi:hypothetical protein
MRGLGTLLPRVLALAGTILAPAQGALLAHTSGGGASSPTSAAIDTSGATLLVVTVNTYGGAAVTVGDSRSNAWTRAVTQSNGPDATVSIYYAWQNLALSSAHTVTLSGSGVYAGYTFAAYSGTKTTGNPLDATSASVWSGGSTGQTAAFTPMAAGETIVTSVAPGYPGTTPFSIDTGFSVVDQVAGAGGVNVPNASGYLFQSAAAAVAPLWSWSGSSYTGGAGVIAGFLPAVTTGGTQAYIF